MDIAEVILVGGGVAGLATAWALSRLGTHRIILLEQEDMLGTHSSGRNAAILRHLEHEAWSVALARRSVELIEELAAGGEPLIRKTGALHLGDRSSLKPLAAAARELGLPVAWLSAEEARAASPLLAPDLPFSVLHVPMDGVIDIHGLVTRLAKEARARGVTVRTGTRVEKILTKGERVIGVRTDQGETLASNQVVIAAGAWSGELGGRSGAPIRLEPRRRHLVLLSSDEPVRADGPVVWCLDPEVYFRPESRDVLASPCDEMPWEPGIPPVAPDAVVSLAERLAQIAPTLAVQGRIKRSWACLRTFAPDRAFACGEDPRLRGLFWAGGLGGRGMTTGLAFGELVAKLLVGRDDPLQGVMRPSRLV